MLPKKVWLFLVVGFVITVPTTSYLITQKLAKTPMLNGRTLQPSRQLPEFELESTKGKPFGLGDMLGKWSVLSFGFTHCPDICPATLAYFRDELESLSTDAQDRVQFIFVSVDPERDSREAMQAYIDAFDERIIGLRGSQEQLEHLASAFGAYFHKEGSGENYQMAHSPHFFLISPDGQWHAFYTPPLERGGLAVDLQRLTY